MSRANSSHLVDPAVFDWLQSKIDDDQKVRDEIRDIVQDVEKQEKFIDAHLTNSFALSQNELPNAIKKIEDDLIKPLISKIQTLSSVASQHPYYKFNQMWTMKMQDAVYEITMCGWLGGFGTVQEGRLLTIDEVGQILGVPVNVKDKDTFHLTIEEYLHGLITLIDDLARLSRISVTTGNYERPLMISQFVKDLHAGFQILNLKNDALRRRNDGIKYRLRDVEDVVYDLSLRGLIPKP